jgi:hypothetical protein
MTLHEILDWLASIVLMTIGYFTRLVFGEDHLNRWQLILFYLFCGGVLYITNTYINPGIIRSSIQLAAGLVIPNLINGIIKGAKKSEKIVSKTVEKNVQNISDKVDNINDILHDDK